MSDQRYYEIVAQELQDRVLRPGLWTRAVAETGDEESAARALYIRFRVAELMQQEQAERIRADAEAQRRAAEEERADQRGREAEAIARQEQERRLAVEMEAEQMRRDQLEAASPYTAWIAVGSIIALLFLFIWLIYIFS